LLNGEIIEMSPIGVPHAKCVRRLSKRLDRKFGDRVEVDTQNPIELPSDGRPQPDIVLYDLELHDTELPRPENIYLVIEVSDSTLRDDRTTKLINYARDGIKEYWIVNLINSQLEVYRDPEGERYATTFTVKPGVNQACLAFPDEPIDWQ
jgi:Uma2 family endonuclease